MTATENSKKKLRQLLLPRQMLTLLLHRIDYTLHNGGRKEGQNWSTRQKKLATPIQVLIAKFAQCQQ